MIKYNNKMLTKLCKLGMNKNKDKNYNLRIKRNSKRINRYKEIIK